MNVCVCVCVCQNWKLFNGRQSSPELKDAEDEGGSKERERRAGGDKDV